MKHTVEEQFFGVRPAACSQRAVGAKILVDESDLDTLLVKICENLAPGTCGQASTRWTRVGFSHHILSKFTSLNTSPEVAIIEQPAKLGRACYANSRRRRHGNLI